MDMQEIQNKIVPLTKANVKMEKRNTNKGMLQWKRGKYERKKNH